MPDPFGDNLKVPSTQRFVSLKLHTKLTAGATASPSDLKFGFNATSDAILAYYECFSSGTSVLAAVKSTIERFSIPADLDDIAAMPEGSLAIAESTGILKFFRHRQLACPSTNPLASVGHPQGRRARPKRKRGRQRRCLLHLHGRLPNPCTTARRQNLPARPSIENEAPTTTLNRRTPDRPRSPPNFATTTSSSSSCRPSAPMHPSISSSSRPPVSPSTKAKPCNPPSKKPSTVPLEIGLSLELSASSTSDAMFLYEVDLDALQTRPGRLMLHNALEGDFSGLVSADAAPPTGIHLLKSVLSTGKQRQYSLKINLLGIFNHLELSKTYPAKHRRLGWTPPVQLVLMESRPTASKVQIDTSNLVRDSSKLRKALAETSSSPPPTAPSRTSSARARSHRSAKLLPPRTKPKPRPHARLPSSLRRPRP